MSDKQVEFLNHLNETTMPENRDAILAIIAKAVGAYTTTTLSQIQYSDQLEISRRILNDLQWSGYKILKIDNDVS